MASTSVSRIPPASPERLWQLIGGFHALPDWLPFIPESTALEGGRAYSILEAPFGCTRRQGKNRPLRWYGPYGSYWRASAMQRPLPSSTAFPRWPRCLAKQGDRVNPLVGQLAFRRWTAHRRPHAQGVTRLVAVETALPAPARGEHLGLDVNLTGTWNTVRAVVGPIQGFPLSTQSRSAISWQRHEVAVLRQQLAGPGAVGRPRPAAAPSPTRAPHRLAAHAAGLAPAPDRHEVDAATVPGTPAAAG